MRVVVVGGTGNVGLGVLAALRARHHEVIVLSREAPVGAGEGLRHLSVDRGDRACYESVLGEVGGDAVIDLISFSAADAESTVQGAGGVRSMILCSSTSVYGR